MPKTRRGKKSKEAKASYQKRRRENDHMINAYLERSTASHASLIVAPPETVVPEVQITCELLDYFIQNHLGGNVSLIQRDMGILNNYFRSRNNRCCAFTKKGQPCGNYRKGKFSFYCHKHTSVEIDEPYPWDNELWWFAVERWGMQAQ